MSGCGNFEPQAWRQNKCVNCFRARDEHKVACSSVDPKSRPVPHEPAAANALALRPALARKAPTATTTNPKPVQLEDAISTTPTTSNNTVQRVATAPRGEAKPVRAKGRAHAQSQRKSPTESLDAAVSQQPQSKRSTETTESKGPSTGPVSLHSMLADIRSGVDLRHVEEPASTTQTSGSATFVSMTDELHWKLRQLSRASSKHNHEQLRESLAKTEFNRMCEELEGNDCCRSLSQLQSTIHRARHVVQTLGVPAEYLQEHFKWPATKIAAGESILHLMRRLDDSLVQCADLVCHDQDNVVTSCETMFKALDTAIRVVNNITKGATSHFQHFSSRLNFADALNNQPTEDEDKSEAHEDDDDHMDPLYLPPDTSNPASTGGRLVPKLRDCTTQTLQLAMKKAMQDFQDCETSAIHFNQSSKAARVYHNLDECCRFMAILKSLGVLQSGPLLDSIEDQAVQFRQKIMTKFSDAVRVRNRVGNWDKREEISLRGRQNSPAGPGVAVSTAQSRAVLQAIRDGQSKETVHKLLVALIEAHVSSHAALCVYYKSFARAAISTDQLDMLDLLRQDLLSSLASAQSEESDTLVRQSTNIWLGEAVGLGKSDAVRHLLSMGADCNWRNTSAGGVTAAHICARRGDVSMLLLLMSSNANLQLRNGLSQSPLDILSLKTFVKPRTVIDAENSADTQGSQGSAGFAAFFDCAQFSDVTLTTEDGGNFSAHRVVLSACSSVFRVMLGGDFKESLDDEVMLPGVTSQSLRELLRFVYTGQCELDARKDSVVVAAELLEVAGRFMMDSLMRHLEEMLLPRIDKHTVVSLYLAAEHTGASRLLCATRHFFTAHFNHVEMPHRSKSTFAACGFSDKNALLEHLMRHYVEAKPKDRSGLSLSANDRWETTGPRETMIKRGTTSGGEPEASLEAFLS